MSDLLRIKIEERVYSVQKFNPMDGMEYGVKLAAMVAPALGGLMAAEESKKKGDADYGKLGADFARSIKDPDLMPMFKKAFGQCWTPENESLGDEAVFNKWFQQHPGDMFELGGRAAFLLSRDFFPSQLGTMLSDYLERLNLASQSTASA